MPSNEKTSKAVAKVAGQVLNGQYEKWTYKQIIEALTLLAASALTQAPDKKKTKGKN